MPLKKFQTSQRFGDIEDYWDEQDKEKEAADKKSQKKQKQNLKYPKQSQKLKSLNLYLIKKIDTTLFKK